ncbi:MAG: amidohydrolase family protein [Verrucomicrobia bacterium]|nr:amidohydrolase family protein [Verrucomicrobiota bacterium]MBU1734547.1 amidohydrolase family protein [Verrucomicrobiota bacterium]MBU1856616.1 amidohydrolase family protein [Verrucomicrobiota bacterium]
MKIIDAHTHLPGWSFGSRPRPIRELRRAFEDEGLAGAWLFTTDGLLGEPARNNDILAEAVAEHRDFFAPFCTVNPLDGTDAAIRELDRCKSKLGMRGLKLHPWVQAFSMMHPAVEPVLAHAGNLGFPVIFHDGTPPYTSSLQIAALAEKAPQTTIILGHAGLDDLYEDAILACRRHPNIYLCLCSTSGGYSEQIIRHCPVERLLFGSDGGFMPNLIKLAIAKLHETDAPASVLRKIFYDNPQRLLPLPA